MRKSPVSKLCPCPKIDHVFGATNQLNKLTRICSRIHCDVSVCPFLLLLLLLLLSSTQWILTHISIQMSSGWGRALPGCPLLSTSSNLRWPQSAFKHLPRHASRVRVLSSVLMARRAGLRLWLRLGLRPELRLLPCGPHTLRDTLAFPVLCCWLNTATRTKKIANDYNGKEGNEVAGDTV